MIEKVKVTATYDRHTQVPRIGQRKRMLVNGQPQFLTLNALTVTREFLWDEEHGRDTYMFEAQEEWGTYFIS